MFSNTTHAFDKVELKRTIKVNCRDCGRAAMRVVKDFQTINPFNKGRDGSPKSRDEIHSELKRSLDQKAKVLKEAGYICKRCKPDQWESTQHISQEGDKRGQD